MDTTPIIHKNGITDQKYIGVVETPSETHIVRITLADGSQYLVAGGACNAGLLPTRAREIDEYSTIDDVLPDFVADLEAEEAGDYPSGELLSWHGSMVI